MNKLANFNVNVVVDGLEGTVSSEWIQSKIVEELDEYKIQSSENIEYPLLRILLMGKSMIEVPGTYYIIEFSVIHHSVTIEEYSESFTYNEQINKFRVSKLYEHQSIGYSNNEHLRERLLTALDGHMSLFISQWFADNPRRQY
jgi:hypothetical protein